MSVIKSPEYEAAMSIITNSDSDTATTSQSHRPNHISKLWTSLSFHQDEHAENVLRRMQALMESRKFCDVILVAGIDGKRVSAHRLILAATSEYFANLFAPQEPAESPMEEPKEIESETEDEEELTTTKLAEDVLESRPEEVTLVGLLRRKGNEEEEQYVTMKGVLRLKPTKQGESSEFHFIGTLNQGRKSEEEEEVEEVKCTKDFYNEECKKLEPSLELTHCVELEPGEYYRSYPEIVSQEINSRIIKSIDALCLEAKIGGELQLEQTAIAVEEDRKHVECLKEESNLCNNHADTKQVQFMKAEEVISEQVAKQEVSAIPIEDSSATSESIEHNQMKPNEFLDPLLSRLAPDNNEPSLLVRTLKSGLKKFEEADAQKQLTQVENALDKIRVVIEKELTPLSSQQTVKNKEVKVVDSADKREFPRNFIQLRDRMKGGGVDEPADKDLEEPTISPSILPQAVVVKKTHEPKEHKKIKSTSHTAEFDIRDNDKPLRLSLVYESKNKEISLKGKLSSNVTDSKNPFKITRLGKNAALQQQVEKNHEETLNTQKKNSKLETETARLEDETACALKTQQHVKNRHEVILGERDELSISNWFRSESNEKAVGNQPTTSLDMLPSTSVPATALIKKKAGSGHSITRQSFNEMLEVWKREDWKQDNVFIPKVPPKKPKKDRLGTLRRHFERKEKSPMMLEERQAYTTVLVTPLKEPPKEGRKEESRLGKIKNLFMTQNSSKQRGDDAQRKQLSEGGSKQSMASTTTTLHQQSSLEIKRVSIEYIAEEARSNKLMQRNWLKRSKQQDINDKVLSSITEEDEPATISEDYSTSEKTPIDKAEMKLLGSWRCLDRSTDRSSDSLKYPVYSVLPDDLDKLDISRKPIHNIAKKPQDNRTLAELFHDLIQVETQSTPSAKDSSIDTGNILDSFLRENLEAHAAALCDDIDIQRKVTEQLEKEKIQVAPVEELKKETTEQLQKEKIVVAPVEEFKKETTMPVAPVAQLKKETIEVLPIVLNQKVNEFEVNVAITERKMEGIVPKPSSDDDEAIAALVGPQLSQLSMTEQSILPNIIEPFTVPDVKPHGILKKVQLPEHPEISRVAHNPRPQKLSKRKTQKHTFEPKKYWHTPHGAATSPPKKAKKKKHKSTNQPKEVLLDSVNGITLQLLVDYCYTGNIEFQEETTAKNVLATAGMLKLKDIVRECTNFLARKLHPSNCLGIVQFAQEQNYKRLFEEAKDYASRHFAEVCKYHEFYELSAENLALILASDELNLPCEEEVFNCIMSWTQHDRDNRLQHLPLMLQQLRLPLMQPSFILKYVEPVCALSTPACHRLVIDALKWHLLPSVERLSMQPPPSAQSVRPRKSKVPWSNNVGTLMAVGYNISEKTITLESFCPSLNKWSITKRKRMLPGRKGYGVAVLNDELLIIGGYEDWDGAKALNTVLSLDMKSLNWTLLQPMSECRYGSSVVVMNDSVYVMGGGDYYRTGFLHSVERWDSETYTWSHVAPMQTKRIYAGAVVLDNRLYVVGGSNETEYLNSMECFDPYRNQWQFKAPMSERRSECGVAAAHGYIYVVGGFSNGSRTCAVERYNPISDNWTRVCSLETARSCCGCSALGNRLLTLGGYDEIGASLRSVEEYNINMNQWEQFPALTSRYFSLYVVTLLDKGLKSAQCFRYGDSADDSSYKVNKLKRNCVVLN